ncbi:tetraspanin-6-like isoform X2 [Cimex lectularius]|uniref:Tetraspanin n=1 Tax=Cimex lectularius TaxID=79782 RepID=A0A8I6SDY3_CIMLE|nr:tetraspanin-6-like isoform X2 [Cimex lectularius]
MCLMKKLCLLIATLITGMIGVGMIILGRKKMNEVVFLDAFLEDHIHIGRTFISLGFVLFVIASIGLVGLICHVSLLLQIYACLMLAMVVTQIVVGVAVFSRMESIKQALYKTLEEKFRTYDEHKAEIDKLQSVLLCCGMSGPKEWKIKELPPSCCGQTSGSCSVKSAYTASCSVRAKQTVKIGIYFPVA